jgi:hypothetical protein
VVAETRAKSQVVAENGLTTRKAGAVGLGLRVLTWGYRFVRYPVFSGENRTVFEHVAPGRERHDEG